MVTAKEWHWILTAAIFILGAACFMLERKLILDQVTNFDIHEANVTVPTDRDIVEHNIRLEVNEYMQRSGQSDERDRLDIFNEIIRTKVAKRVKRLTGYWWQPLSTWMFLVLVVARRILFDVVSIPFVPFTKGFVPKDFVGPTTVTQYFRAILYRSSEGIGENLARLIAALVAVHLTSYVMTRCFGSVNRFPQEDQSRTRCVRDVVIYTVSALEVYNVYVKLFPKSPSCNTGCLPTRDQGW